MDRVLFMGDVCGYYPYVEECITALRAVPIDGVLGNHDQVLLDALETGSRPPAEYEEHFGTAIQRSVHAISEASRSFLAALPLARTAVVDGVKLALWHGAPWDPLMGRVYPDEQHWERLDGVDGDIILLGHTHYPLAAHVRGKLVVNPGSVGQPRDLGSSASYAVLDVAAGAVEHRRITFDPTDLVADARKHDPGVPYLVDVLERRR